MEKDRVTRTDWKIEPMVNGTPIPYTATFDADQFAILQQGVKPKEMEQKWFVYYEAPVLHFHRSWTGLPIFEVDLTPNADGARVTAARCALSNMKNTTAESAADMLEKLVSYLVLGRL